MIGRLRFLGNLPIRFKVLLACVGMFAPFALATGWVAYTVMRSALEERITSELRNTTETVRNMVETAVRLSIRNYLRSVAETNREIVADIYQKARRGEMTEEEARRRAVRTLLSQRIGQTGYLYCVDSRGTAVVHPDRNVQGRNFAGQSFVAEQMRRKEGYVEYEWRNPGEPSARPKALSMVYFEPWDWIISATAYRTEFGALVNIEDFRQSVASLRFGKSGYSYVLDLAGNLIVHPVFQGRNAFDVGPDGETQFLREILQKRRGHQSYSWKNPGDSALREKIVFYDFVPQVGWIVASSAYLDDLYEPLEVIRGRAVAAALVCLVLGLGIAARVGSSITTPIRKLADRLIGKPSKGPPVQVWRHGQDEVRQLSAFFDRFMEELDREARERRQAEQQLRSSEERYRALMEAAPDPIMVVNRNGEVTYLNLAFTRAFGWEPVDFRGEALRAFVPGAERERVRRHLGRLLAGATVTSEESVRATRDGQHRTVSVSGGPFRDAEGQLAGCVLLLRDVTDVKRLERELIDGDERERIRIGQDLHDDLVPHLIGIDVMYKVLRRRMGPGAGEVEEQADALQGVITEAILKTRALSRGLSPVHLVEEGLEVGLRQLADTVETIFAIPCEVEWQGVVSLDTTTAVHVYRIVQEALHNAVKHAGADRLRVTGRMGEETAVIEVADDGSGLSESAPPRGMGLRIMAFRARMIGGRVDVVRGEDGGTVVRLSVQQRT